MVRYPFIYDYGDSMTCPYDTFSPEDFSMKACKNLYYDATPEGGVWYWVGRVSDLSKLNQVLALYLVVQAKEPQVSKFDLSMKLWVRARHSGKGHENILSNGDLLHRTIDCVF